jgi:hypothetical protein
MFGLLFAIISLCVYFLPTIIAGNRGHHRFWLIAMVNFFFGITLIGWLIAFIWSLSPVPNRSRVY